MLEDANNIFKKSCLYVVRMIMFKAPPPVITLICFLLFLFWRLAAGHQIPATLCLLTILIFNSIRFIFLFFTICANSFEFFNNNVVCLFIKDFRLFFYIFWVVFSCVLPYNAKSIISLLAGVCVCVSLFLCHCCVERLKSSRCNSK